MKLTKELLHKLIKEQLTVPEFEIRGIANDCADKLHEQLKRYINSRANSQDNLKSMYERADKIKNKLSDEIFDILQAHLNSFVQKS